MKYSLFLILILSLSGCNKNDSDSESEKYFNAEGLYQLDLAHIDAYWDEGINIDTSFYMGANFESHPGFIEGIRLYSGNGKAIWISVFNTKEDAINAMEIRRNNVACVIHEGDPNEFETPWWYSECLDFFIFVNQYNTIVEIDFSSCAPFEVIKEILLNVADEIIGRIDRLSD